MSKRKESEDFLAEFFEKNESTVCMVFYLNMINFQVHNSKFTTFLVCNTFGIDKSHHILWSVMVISVECAGICTARLIIAYYCFSDSLLFKNIV
jgi:hypothetical protein